MLAVLGIFVSCCPFSECIFQSDGAEAICFAFQLMYDLFDLGGMYYGHIVKKNRKNQLLNCYLRRPAKYEHLAASESSLHPVCIRNTPRNNQQIGSSRLLLENISCTVSQILNPTRPDKLRLKEIDIKLEEAQITTSISKSDAM